MKIVLMCITDGRKECLSRTLNSYTEKVTGDITSALLVDDSADLDYRLWLDENYSELFDKVIHHKVRQGFAGALQSAWNKLPACDFIFHLEDDFIFNRKVNLNELAYVLKYYPYLAQMVFKRQPVNEAEQKAGDIVQLAPNEYRERAHNGFYFTEHHRNFSTNPCVYPLFIAKMGFPQEPSNNERIFSEKLNTLGFRYAFWGKKFDAPIVEHIGYERIGVGY